MREVTVFVGGSVGSDPYSPATWSGTSAPLLKAMDAVGILDKAIGVKVPRLQTALLQAASIHPNRPIWRQQFYLDIAYRNALTKAAGIVAVASPICLQYGTMLSLPTVFPRNKCISYQDGNLAQALEGGFNMQGVPRKRIDAALHYEEQVSQQMTAVLTFSEYLRQSFIHDYHVPAERVFNIGAGVNLTDPPPAQPAKDYSAARLLFIGIDFKRKGGPHLLEAFATVRQRFAQAELHIVGPANLDPIPPGVIFHGRLSKTDPAQKAKLESLFLDSTLFVLPSLYEPFGIAPLEAMLYQLPCVLTDAWALREFVTPGQNGDLVEKGSAQDLAAKICNLLAHPDRLARMGQIGRELVLSRYTWSASAARMSEIIKAL